MIAFFIQGTAIGLTAAASPGPFQAYTINQTLTEGWRHAAPLAFVPLVSDFPIIVIMLFLLDKLPRNMLSLISIAGGIFIIYLAWGYWQKWKTDLNHTAELRNDPNGGFRKGVLMNLLSPGPYTFWALVNGPILLTAFRISIPHGIAFITGFYLVLAGGFLLLVFLFDQVRRFGVRVVRSLLLGSIIILLVFGVFLILEGLNKLLV